MKLAQAQQSTGDLARCSATLLEAIDLVPGDDVALRVRLTSACAACEHFLGQHEPAQRRLVAALEALPDQGGPEAVAVLLALSTGSFFTGEVERMCDTARRGLAAARVLGEPALIGTAAAVLAHGCANGGLVAEARSNADEAAARLDQLPDDSARAAPRRRQPARVGGVPHRALRRLDPPRRSRSRHRRRHRSGAVHCPDPQRASAEHGGPRRPLRGHRAAGGRDRGGGGRRQRLHHQRGAHRNRADRDVSR